MITMYARLNSLNPRDHRGWFWFLRKASLLVTATACAMIMAAPVAKSVPYWWELVAVMFVWGVFGAFFTSPQQKPWWDLIFGDHRGEPATSTQHLVWRELVAFWKAISKDPQ